MDNAPGAAGHHQPAAADWPLFMPPYPNLAPLAPSPAPQQPLHLLPPHLQFLHLPPLRQQPTVSLDRDTYQVLVEVLARAQLANGTHWGARDFEEFQHEVQVAYDRVIGLSAGFDVPGEPSIADVARDRAARIDRDGARRHNGAIAEQQRVKAREAFDEYLRMVDANGNAVPDAETIQRMTRLLAEARYRSDVAEWAGRLRTEPAEQLYRRRRLLEQ
jgi:hypothetical protein